MFRKLMLDGRRHFQGDLAEEFQCSPQTIIRLAAEIESVIGMSLEFGLENRRRWYQIRTISRSRLGLEFEELRYLSVCRDLAASSLPEQVSQRVDNTIFALSLLMADHAYAEREKAQKHQFAFFSKGCIDYTPHFEHIEKLLHAVEDRLVCLVRYKAVGKTEDKEHRFAPSRIISMNGALYALGAGLEKDFSTQRHNTNLAIHRIQDVIVTEKRHALPFSEADPQTFGLPWHEPRTFRIHFKAGKAAEYVRERIWADEQQMEEKEDGTLILTLTTRSEPEVTAWVRSFGEEAEVLHA
jgi:predicted DNA-binding transcriptional regulator YafY